MATKFKHRQHHVCQAYLRGWSTNEKIWTLQDRHVRSAAIKDVAVQRHFYKLEALTDFEIAYIRAWIAKSPQSSRRIHENYLTMFAMLPTARARLTEAHIAAHPDVVAEMDVEIVNAQEEFHSGMEGRCAPLIGALRRGDTGLFKDEQLAIQFVHFLALQHFRTSGMKARVTERFMSHSNFDISKCWNILAHIVSSNVGLSLYVARKASPLVLIVNETEVPFITSDQPTVNLLGREDGIAPDHMALYYPVSPRYAVLFDEAENPCGLANKVLSADDVRSLNAKEVRASYRQVFAERKETLLDIAVTSARAA